jgi:hypothetical protein
MKMSLEKAARALLGKTDDENDAKRREHGYRPKITLPRLKFLEKPMPPWDEPNRPAPTKPKGQRAGSKRR